MINIEILPIRYRRLISYLDFKVVKIEVFNNSLIIYFQNKNILLSKRKIKAINKFKTFDFICFETSKCFFDDDVEFCKKRYDKIRIANNLFKIKHWNIIFGDAFDYPIEKNTTEFIDPPYTVQKHKYNFHTIDYENLNNLIKKIENNNNQVIVCGNTDDKWLNFIPMVRMQGTNKNTIECIYSNYPTNYDNKQQTLF
ncbi:MAG: hypothetical protein GY849_02585 [Deltaproteobacteria bacterium]|nr:hypothetical protein [Deltaproteobacteria bacterium]